MQTVTIQHSVVDPFTGSAVVVNLLICIRSTSNRGIKADVPIRFGIDTATIRRGRTCFLTSAGIDFVAGKGATPFAGMLLFAVSPVDHAESSHAQGCAIFVNGEGIRDGCRASAVVVEVDERVDVPFVAEAIGGIVVMGRVQAEICDGDVRVDCPKFTQTEDGAHTVMSSGI